MVFSSLPFLFFYLTPVLLVSFLCPRKAKNLVLFLASLLFYAWGEPLYILLMLFSVGFNYLCGRWIDQAAQKNSPAWKKRILVFSVVVNLGLLGFFKYAGFLVENLGALFARDFAFRAPQLPIGISFYTFQALSYVIDVYRGGVGVQRSFIRFGTYIAFFPQLIAGPIVRYSDIEAQLEDRRVTPELFAQGIRRFVIGLGKKVLIANQVYMLWKQVGEAASFAGMPALTAWLGAVAFTFQIYFDFSGYSDMAIGLGRMFGFTFPENFDTPYVSKSITEFWRRWHISLSSWFREYLYIPLGGNRRGKRRQAINLLIVWALTGLWHGASWNFLLWGLYFGVILILEKYFLLQRLDRLPRAIRHLYALLLVVVGWVLFALEDFSQIGRFLAAMCGAGGLADGGTLFLFYSNALLLLAAGLGSTSLPRRAGNALCRRLEGRPVVLTVLQNVFFVAVLVCSIACLVGDSYNPFLYFRF